MQQEVELKLEVDPAELAAVHEAIRQAGVLAGTTALRSTYFDTRKQKLRKAGVSLCVRQDGRRTVQTIKVQPTASAGLYDRPEWEQDISGERPVLDDVTGNLEGVVGKALGPKGADRLRPVISSSVTRTIFHAAVGETQIEIAIDEGQVTGGRRAQALCEVELELKAGSSGGLFALARQIDAVAPTRLGVLTKADRGYRLLDETISSVTRAEPIELSRDMTAATAFQTIAWSCLRHYRLNESLAVSNPAALHQARVALRRLRSAFSLFKPVIADTRSDHLRGELRWLSGVLGEARNLDVLIERTEDPDLLGRLHLARRNAYDAASAAAASSRSRGVMLDLAEWLALGPWLTAPTGASATPAKTFSAEVFERYRRRVKRLGRELAEVDDEQRHELRIEAKKLRYATEFFATLYRGKRASRRREQFRRRLEALQEQLGTLNDMATAPLVLASIGERAPVPDMPDAAAHTELLRATAVSQKELVKEPRFW